jgi:hypothetical protein
MVRSAISTVVCAVAAFFLVFSPQAAFTQSAAPAASTGAVPSAGANSGTYYIEDEILTYKSLQVNGASIAADLKKSLPADLKGIVVVPSASTLLPAFQLWRSNMLVTKTYITQADNTLKAAYTMTTQPQPGGGSKTIWSQTGPCPAQQIPQIGASTSFAGYATGITQGVGVIQSILSLFTTNVSASGYAGTVQDQALMTAVSREIRAADNTGKLVVLLPDVIAPWNIDAGDDPANTQNRYFVGQLKLMVSGLSNLEDYYQCNSLIVASGQALAQAEQSLDADLTKLATTTVAAKDLPSIEIDIANQKAQIQLLRGKIGLNLGPGVVADWNAALDSNLPKLVATTTTPGEKLTILANLRAAEAKVLAMENPNVIIATITAAKIQTIVTGIGGYLSALTGGAVSVSNLTPATTSPQPAAASAGAAPAAGQTSPGGTGAPTTPAGGVTQAAAAPSSSTPPIMTILQADGLAREMGVEPDDATKPWDSKDWRVVWLKSMDSGSTTDMRTNIWGSSPRFAGGAVSGYALFRMDGHLVCSGNVAAYGGSIVPDKFAESMTDDKKPPVATMINLASTCTVIPN